jgi:hypothetical protein
MLSDPIEVEYPLTLSPFRNLAMAGCAVGVTAGVAVIAATNSKGLSLFSLVTLSAEEATLFLWALTAVCGLFALLALALSWRAVFVKQRVAFTQSSIWIPRTNWSTELVEVPLRQIAAADLWSYGSERVVTLVLANRKFRIGQSWLPTPGAFEDVLARLQQGMQARKK